MAGGYWSHDQLQAVFDSHVMCSVALFSQHNISGCVICFFHFRVAFCIVLKI
jgi:hypothetical protein